jgi:hypothetical protein
VDIVSDGELGKPGFSTYIERRFTGFEGRSEFQADDVAPFPNLAMRLFNTPAMAHVIFSNCVRPVELKDPDVRPIWRWPPIAGRLEAASRPGRLTCRPRSKRSMPRWTASRRSRCACTSAGATMPALVTRSIIGEVLKANVGTIYPEGANPRHEHEWRVFEDVELPEDKSIILGVIDVKSNCIVHPQVVADRLTRLAKIVGRERVLAGTDCGFDTFIRFSQVDPDVAWEKLRALSEGARLASDELW